MSRLRLAPLALILVATDHSLPKQLPSFLHGGTRATSYLRCLRPHEHVLARNSRLEFLSFGSIDILAHIVLCHWGLSRALEDV